MYVLPEKKSGFENWQCTMNNEQFCFPKAAIKMILSKNGKIFFIFSKKIAVFDDFSKWRVLNVLQISRKSSNIAKIWGNEENLAIFTII